MCPFVSQIRQAWFSSIGHTTFPLGPGWSLTKWLVYSDSGRPASRHTLQKGVGAATTARVDELVFLLVAGVDDDIVYGYLILIEALLYV